MKNNKFSPIEIVLLIIGALILVPISTVGVVIYVWIKVSKSEKKIETISPSDESVNTTNTTSVKVLDLDEDLARNNAENYQHYKVITLVATVSAIVALSFVIFVGTIFFESTLTKTDQETIKVWVGALIGLVVVFGFILFIWFLRKRDEAMDKIEKRNQNASNRPEPTLGIKRQPKGQPQIIAGVGLLIFGLMSGISSESTTNAGEAVGGALMAMLFVPLGLILLVIGLARKGGK